MAEIITAEELATFLELPPGDVDPDRAALIIGHVSGLILGHLQRTELLPATEEAPTVVDLDGTGTGLLVLPLHPVVDLLELVEDPRGSATVLVDDVDFEWTRSGLVRHLAGRFAYRARWYRATFRAGLTATDVDAVKGVACRVCARAVMNPEGLTNESAGGAVSGFAFDDTRLPTLSAPDRRDLERYRVQVGAG